MLEFYGKEKTVLDESYGYVDVSQVKQIKVWCDTIKEEMGFVLNGMDQGIAATINAKLLYGYIWVKAKRNMRVSVVPTEGEMLRTNV